MSLELVDSRFKATQETDAVLEAMHRATGRDKSEITREVMHQWAMQRAHESALTMKLMRAKGLTGSDGE